MRVLFCMGHAGFARNFESTLRALDDRGHDVVVALDKPSFRGPRDDPGLLHALERELAGLSVTSAPVRRRAGWSETGQRIRQGIDYMRFLEPEYAPAAKPRGRAAEQAPRALVALARRRALRPMLRRVLAAAERSAPLERAVLEFVDRVGADVVAVTPLVDLGSPQLDYVRAARRLGKPSALCVASWDNLTMRGGIEEAPDLVIVWNELQAREAVELHGVARAQVAITGAGAYDHWFDWQPSRDREAFCAEVGLDPGSAFVLYAGSSDFIAPAEPDFVSQWVEEVRRHAALRDLQVLYRPHPTNAPDASQRRHLEASSGVVVHPPVGTTPTDDGSRQDYYDSIFHSAAVAGVNTSAFVESAILGRPTHAVLTDRYRETQEGTLHFRYLLPNAGGVLDATRSFDQHAERLAASINGGTDAVAPDARAFVDSFVRPCGRDTTAGTHVADALEAAHVTGKPRRPSVGGLAFAGMTRAMFECYVRLAYR